VHVVENVVGSRESMVSEYTMQISHGIVNADTEFSHSHTNP